MHKWDTDVIDTPPSRTSHKNGHINNAAEKMARNFLIFGGKGGT